MDIPAAGPALLHPRDYLDPAIARAERERLFARCWQFVCFTDQLARPGDWLTREIAGRPVVVQRGDEGFRAFLNVCTHRFARIARAERGSGPLRCGYHGWTYDREGVPRGIPGNDTCFGLDREARQARALARFAVEACGRFLFVRLESGGPGLADFLGPAMTAHLHHLSAVFAPPFTEAVLPWEADWKVGIENVLETYHVDSVHPDTFRKVVAGGWDCTDDPPHSTGVTGLTEEAQRWWGGLTGRLGLAASDRLAGYHHVLVWPNLAIGITAGVLMSAQTYEPTGPERFDLRYRLCLAQGREGAGRRAMEAHLATLNRDLLAEDAAIGAEVQRGTRHAPGPALLGRQESRIAWFQRAWADMVREG